MALREYVPGSQLLARGQIFTSRGVLKHWSGETMDYTIGFRGQFARCKRIHFYYWVSDRPKGCPLCGETGIEGNIWNLLFPKYAFTSAEWDPPYFGTEIERVGKAEVQTITFAQGSAGNGMLVEPDFAGIPALTAKYKEDAELLVHNEGANGQWFAICLKCGYADSEPITPGEGQVNLPKDFENHAPIHEEKRWKSCWRSTGSPVIRKMVLAARETTDALYLDFSACRYQMDEDGEVATTVGYALQ